jgi:hypothetical protein
MKNLRTKLSYALYTLLACVFISCGNQTDEQTPTNNVKKKDSGINFVGRYEIEEGGMKYIVYREVDGGLFILNITKDSLDVERLRNAR